MPEETTTNNQIDLNSFKNELIEHNKSIFNELKNEVLSQVQNTISNQIETLKPVTKEVIQKANDEVLNDFADEINTLGIEEGQAKALINMMGKFINKKTGELEGSILNKVDTSLNTRETIKTASSETLMMFPDIKNKNSNLFKESQRILKTMSDTARMAPEAESIAVERAALRLGIAPRTLKDINALEAQNPTNGEVDSGKKVKTGVSASTAKLFGVDPEKVNNILKQKGLL